MEGRALGALGPAGALCEGRRKCQSGPNDSSSSSRRREFQTAEPRNVCQPVEHDTFRLLCRGACPHAQVWIQDAAEDSRLYTEPVAQTKRIWQFIRIGVGRF